MVSFASRDSLQGLQDMHDLEQEQAREKRPQPNRKRSADAPTPKKI